MNFQITSGFFFEESLIAKNVLFEGSLYLERFFWKGSLNIKMQKKNILLAQIGALRSKVGVQAGAQLPMIGRSASRSATPNFLSERNWSATPTFAGTLMLWILQIGSAYVRGIFGIF